MCLLPSAYPALQSPGLQTAPGRRRLAFLISHPRFSDFGPTDWTCDSVLRRSTPILQMSTRRPGACVLLVPPPHSRKTLFACYPFPCHSTQATKTSVRPHASGEIEKSTARGPVLFPEVDFGSTRSCQSSLWRRIGLCCIPVRLACLYLSQPGPAQDRISPCRHCCYPPHNQIGSDRGLAA